MADPDPQSAPASSPDAPSRPRPKEWIAAIHPYVPGKSTGADGQVLIKLSANENPLGTSTAALAARIGTGAGAGDPARYPDPESHALREALGKLYAIDPARIVMGTGSDELLNLAAQAFAGPGDEVLFVRYGFSVYEIAARRCGAAPVIALDDDYAAEITALLGCVTSRTRVVFIANPNNPTGSWIAGDEIDRLHASLPQNVVLMLDEAYAEYAPPDSFKTALPLAAKAPNVIVTRTFSKAYALASLRIGWATASPVILSAIRRLMPAFGVSGPAQCAAGAALDDAAWLDRAIAHNAAARDKMAQQIAALGFDVVPSGANFLLVRFASEVIASAFDHHLTARGILVRALPIPGLRDCLRMTIGTDAENGMLVTALAYIHQQKETR